jgi:predicted AAA+ superfamily ATPase
MDINSIHKILTSYRFSLENEKLLQLQIENALLTNNIPHSKEYVLDKHNIIDFLCNNGIGIEVKIKGSKRSIYEQVLKYSQFADVKSIILITNKSIGNPPLHENKTLNVLNLGTAWL